MLKVKRILLNGRPLLLNGLLSRKGIALVLFVLMLSGCTAPRYMPMKGNYSDAPYVVETSKSKDEVWDAIVDMFAQTGIGIRIIDKSSGLIISSVRPMLTVTSEGQSGKPLNPEAHVIAPTARDFGSNQFFKPRRAQGEFNIRVKEVNGKTIVNINLLNIETSYYTAGMAGRGVSEFESIGRSLGNFEKSIEKAIL